jgi:predicted nuclease of predicted toxin-antitoxin system
MQAAENVDVLERARREFRVLISADSDFAALLALQEAPQPSFVLFREKNVTSAEQYADLLLSNISVLESDLNRGCVVVFRGGLIRIRSLPISAE